MSDPEEPEKKAFLVRQNCEYSVSIDNATDYEDAVAQANAIPLHDWEQAWSGLEAEED